MRKAARSDENQSDIVKQMRKLGLEVEIIGMPSDLLVAKNMITVVVEVKNPKKDPSQRRLTDQEDKFYNRWKEKGLYCVVEDIEDVLGLVNSMTHSLTATKIFCQCSMELHFSTCYNRRGA